jgi:uncharacterized membrane protein YbhN (UPF0104 family)
VSKALRLGGSGALLAFLAWRTDWRQITAAFAGLRAGWWLAALALYALTQVVSSLRWQLLARPLGFRQPTRQFVAYYYVGMFFNLVLPTSVGGDVVRAWYLGGRSGRKLPAVLSVLADRASGLLMLVAIACSGVALCPLRLPPRVVWAVSAVGLVVLAGVAVLVGMARYSVLGTQYSVLGTGWRAKLIMLHDVMFPRPGVFLLTTLLSLFVQSANVIVLWLIGLSLGLDVPASYYWVLVPAVTLMTLLPVSVNGMGVREWGTVLMLAPLGTSREGAVALAFLWFLTFSAVSVAGGGFYLLGHVPRLEVRPDDEPFRGHPNQGREGQPPAAA